MSECAWDYTLNPKSALKEWQEQKIQGATETETETAWSKVAKLIIIHLNFIMPDWLYDTIWECFVYSTLN